MKSALSLCCAIAVMVLLPQKLCAQKIAENDRSRTAITKVTPGLQKEYKSAGLRWGAPMFIRIFKEEKELELWVKQKKQYVLFKQYAVYTYGGERLGPKLREGDGIAPEGFYAVTADAFNPNSDYYLSFNIGYPNAFDKSLNRTGSWIMIHGSTVSIGCFAMTDSFIEEIYTLAVTAIKGGQRQIPVHVFPFRLSPENMKRFAGSEWLSFWENLKEGYDVFEKNHKPPAVRAVKSRYVFE
jgi:murein L,D-transpeptidase YafK